MFTFVNFFKAVVKTININVHSGGVYLPGITPQNMSPSLDWAPGTRDFIEVLNDIPDAFNENMG